MAAKSTAAPWVVAEENAGGGRTIRDAKGRAVAFTTEVNNAGGVPLANSDRILAPEAKANAVLIAAAPDMLQEHERDLLALDRIAKELEAGRFFAGSPASVDFRDMVKAKAKIVAKARGK